MTTYYVRKTGSDGAAGTSAGAAWATIGKALTGGMASGDTVYIGAGIYREAVTITITPTVTTSVIGDVDGSQTGDAGEVRWTAYTTDDKTAPGANTCITAAKNFLSFQNIHFVGGSGTTGNCVGASPAGHDLTFTRCAFTRGSVVNGGGNEVPVQFSPVVDTAANYVFDSCIFGPMSAASRHLAILAPTSSIADYDLNITVKNCLFVGLSQNNSGGVSTTPSGALAFKPGGLKVLNCTFVGGGVIANTNTSVAFPFLVSNCVMVLDAQTTLSAAAVGQIIEDYNVMQAATPRTNVSIGPYSQATGNYSALLSYGQEAIWGGQPRLYGTPLNNSPFLGFGNRVLAAGRTATVTDDATVGTIAWTNPTNASVPEGTNLAVASTIPITTGVSHYLNAQSFTGFGGIPSDATIQSIRVELLVKATAGSAIACSSVKLLQAGVIVGNDLAASNATQFTTSLVAQSWGNTADPLWGTTWTVAQVQAAGFGCVWAAKNTSAGTQDCSVDFIRVIVAYTTVDGAGGVATDILKAPRPAGGKSTAYAVGALERGQTAVVQTAVEKTAGTPAWQIAGPGYHDFYSNVDAVSTTIGVYAQYDTGGQQPTVTIKAAPELGINADVVLTWADPGANAWAQFTGSITPTATGVIQVRCQTANGTGNAYFSTESAT